jgi:iron-sulfur cluster insertion protein
MAEGGSVTTDGDFQISASAARRVSKLARDEAPGTFLRVSVSGGGCSGFQYGFALETGRQDDDRAFERDGATVVVDETSLDLLKGSELNFVEDLSGAFFQIRNPNAASACGCGMSFSIG